jgi:hypothetical protein
MFEPASVLQSIKHFEEVVIVCNTDDGSNMQYYIYNWEN